MMRNRHRHREVQAVGVDTLAHGLKLIGSEPARILKLPRIDADVFAERFADEADHQARGKWPWLAGDISNGTDPDARLLENFPPRRVLDGLAGLHEAGESRIHARQP